MNDPGASLASSLRRAVGRIDPKGDGIDSLRQLSGGASKETWSFDATGPNGTQPLILRRMPASTTEFSFIEIETEARIMSLLSARGRVPLPAISHVLSPVDDLGRGFIMQRIEGETLGGRIARGEAFAELRHHLAERCGEILAAIHSVGAGEINGLATRGSADQLAEIIGLYDAENWPRPVFDLAIRWLSDHMPEPVPPRLVHGDFRNGNLIVGPEGVRAVLDWEAAHWGDPAEDLGWLSVPSWRFGVMDKPVGGFGTRQQLLDGYENAGGGTVDPERVRFWEILGVLRWGIYCSSINLRIRSGENQAIETIMIAKRASETELDLLALMSPVRQR